MNHCLHIAELEAPQVDSGSVNSTAGEELTLTCNFRSSPDLFRAPTVEWFNSDGLIESAIAITFTSLKTSHAGLYICRVTISIPEVDIVLMENATTTLLVQSKYKPETFAIILYPIPSCIIMLMYS